MKTRLPMTQYMRVNKQTPCPICGKHDWCLIARDGTHAICARTEHGGTFCGEPGWKHKIDGEVRTSGVQAVRERVQIDASAYCIAFERALSQEQLTASAKSLGVSPDSLVRLRMGWCNEYKAMTFPMWQRGMIVGIRVRTMDGDKFSIRDSQNGLFIPRGLNDSDMLLVVEGPTDVAAGLDMGIDTIGKPSDRACADELLRYLIRKRPEITVFVGENDKPTADGRIPGADAAREQCDRAREMGLVAVFVMPPKGKDLREWRSRGATKRMVQALVSNAL